MFPEKNRDFLEQTVGLHLVIVAREIYPLAFGLPAAVPFTRIGLPVRVTVTWIGVGSDRFGKSDADDFKDRIEI